MKYKLIEDKSIGEFDATLEIRSNIENPKITMSSRTWEVYTEDSQLQFTVELFESYCDKGNKILQSVLQVKPVVSLDIKVLEQHKKEWAIFYRTLDDTYCIHCGSSIYPDSYEYTIDISASKYEYVQKLYEYLKSDQYFKFPSELIAEIDSLAYRHVLTEHEITVYSQIDKYVTEDNYDLAIKYIKEIAAELPYRHQDHDFNCYLGDILYSRGQLEVAYKAYNSADNNTLFQIAAVKKSAECARVLSLRENMPKEHYAKWRSAYLSSYIRLSLGSDIDTQDFNNEVSAHFAAANISHVIFNPISGVAPIYEGEVLCDILTSLITMIEQQNIVIQRLSRPGNSITPGYERHISINDRLVDERNSSPEARRAFDKQFGLSLIL